MSSEAVREELLRLELALSSRAPAGASVDLRDLIADDFVEFGAGGRTWSAEAIRELLSSSAAPEPVSIDEFETHDLAPDVVLVTYRITAPGRSHRSSIWVRRDGRWQVRFHQGTRAAS